MDNKLMLKFLTATEGKYFSLTIDKLKQNEDGTVDVSPEQVNDLMKTIIEKNIFVCQYGDIVGKKEAKIVNTKSTSIDLTK
jgi:DUF2922 family protein